MQQLLRKLWPDTLSGQLLLALISGLLAAQALTSTIWHDVRAHRALEIPTRVLATRLADLVGLLDTAACTPALVRQLQSHSFSFSLADTPLPDAQQPPSRLTQDMRSLLEHLLADRLDPAPAIHAFTLKLVPAQDTAPLVEPAWLGWLLQPPPLPDSQFTVELELSPTRWLRVEAREEQGWRITEPWQVFLDYFVRIYLLRILLLIIVVLWAVRLVTRPILRLARAAQALEQDLGSPPMPVEGPVEVRHAATAFNSMQRRLATQLEERTRFLAAVSHDLRSPVTRLMLRTEMLPDSSLKERFRSDLEHMESMIAATLDFMKSGDPGEQRQRIDLNSMLESLRQDAADLGHDVLLHGQTRRTLRGYPRSLKRCLENLLDNALRYGHHATLNIHDEANQIVIVIRDDGPGIPADHLARITEPFYRVESSRNSTTGGYGLGLSIARAVIDTHAGTLSFISPPEGGLEVRVTLPVTPDTAGQADRL
ncbi:MAG: ATP-binding protein [Corticimicrobacter sp.]|uniref:ATP-binding protein n=1 Tax=Corticimicrobacter sp. TaxID=2678536 RepID=UPI0032DA1FA8